MKFDISLHSILMITAPEGVVTFNFVEYFYNHFKSKYPKLKIQVINNVFVSSDEFDLSSDLIILDSRNLSLDHRNHIIELGNEFKYKVVQVVLDYLKKGDYLLKQSSIKKNFPLYDISSTEMYENIAEFRKYVLPTISKKTYRQVIKIHKNDWADFEFNIPEYEFYLSHFLPTDEKIYVIVSDIHGCLNEFKELILKCGSTIDSNDIIDGNKIFIVQDYIDKGYDVGGVVQFIHKNLHNGTILPLIGNHENYVYKRLSTGLTADDELESAYFDSLVLFNENIELRDKFMQIFECSKHFYDHEYFYVNHAPVKERYIGKVNAGALSRQRNYTYPKQGELTDDEYRLVLEESLMVFIETYKRIEKQIFWGHVALQDVTKVASNILMIDTGCVFGNALTGVMVYKDINFIYSIPSSFACKDKNLPKLFAD